MASELTHRLGDEARQDVVIHCDVKQITAPRLCEPAIVGGRDAEVGFVVDKPHAGKAVGIAFQDSDAVIGRGIVEDNYLARRKRLREDGVQRSRQLASVVPVRHHDRQVRGGHDPHAACFCAARWAFMVLMLK